MCQPAVSDNQALAWVLLVSAYPCNRLGGIRIALKTEIIVGLKGYEEQKPEIDRSEQQSQPFQNVHHAQYPFQSKDGRLLEIRIHTKPCRAAKTAALQNVPHPNQAD